MSDSSSTTPTAAPAAATAAATVLVVDDVPLNLRTLGMILRQGGYQVLLASTGLQALEMARERKPDLMLLDIELPGMDGLQVAATLKREGNPLPIVFLTAKTEIEVTVRAFQAGGVDFVTKPFNHPELLARVRTHVQLKRAQDELQQKNRTLEEYSQQLADLNREKNTLMGMAAHDLRSPVNSILIAAELMQALPGMPVEKRNNYLATIHRSAKRMADLIGSLLDAHAIEEGRRQLRKDPVQLRQIVQYLMEANQPKATAKNIAVLLQAPDELPLVQADSGALQQVLDNLVSNAIKFSKSGTAVTIKLLPIGPDVVRCAVIDQGPGLSDDDKKKVFGKFARLSAKPTAGEESTGLGLSIVKRLVDHMGGRIWVESEFGLGATFCFELPVADTALLGIVEPATR